MHRKNLSAITKHSTDTCIIRVTEMYRLLLPYYFMSGRRGAFSVHTNCRPQGSNSGHAIINFQGLAITVTGHLDVFNEIRQMCAIQAMACASYLWKLLLSWEYCEQVVFPMLQVRGQHEPRVLLGQEFQIDWSQTLHNGGNILARKAQPQESTICRHSS